MAMTATTTRTRPHCTPPSIIPTAPWPGPEALLDVASEAFVSAAGRAGRSLPADVFDALNDFGDFAGDSGALLIHDVPIGEVPDTPRRPTAPSNKDTVSEFSLLTVARRLGQPVGYLPEHGGDLVQNIVPVPGSEQRQVSTSSRVQLMFHTEAAFHPHRPHYLLLLCLRGDRDGIARTTLASAAELAPLISPASRQALHEPRFRTAVDESYLDGAPSPGLGAPAAVFYGDPSAPHMVFDADLMVGTDLAAERALAELGAAIEAHHTGVVLEAGDLLIVDNTVAVHGRSPFRPRFDGADRWLQRTFVVPDLAASAADRRGRIVTTRFGA